jgi:ATP-dependent helicase/nuclease subunit B
VHGLPADPMAELLRIGRMHFAPLDDYPEARAFWWPRFQRIARWFVGWEAERRAAADAIHAETSGRLDIRIGEQTFALRARADRIERLADGRYAILDYKTGQVPSDKQVRIGIAPQLTLEGAILRRGGFRDIAAGASLGALIYVKLRGNNQGGEAAPVDLDDRTPDAAADHALAKLTALIAKFEHQETPYRSLVLSIWKNRYGTYDDLARVKEWSATGGADEGDEE